MGYGNPLHGLGSDTEPDLLQHVDMTCPHGRDIDMGEECGRCDEEARRPEVVCLSGSMRYAREMHHVAGELTAQGVIVLMPHVAVAPGEQDGAVKKALDELHFAKIRMSSRLVVVTGPTGYYGESTRAEIAYARNLGQTVTFQAPDLPPEDLVPHPTISETHIVPEVHIEFRECDEGTWEEIGRGINVLRDMQGRLAHIEIETWRHAGLSPPPAGRDTLPERSETGA